MARGRVDQRKALEKRHAQRPSPEWVGYASTPPSHPRTLNKPHKHPPAMTGKLRLSSIPPRSSTESVGKHLRSTRHIPRASAMPVTSPATTPIVSNPAHPADTGTDARAPRKLCETPSCHVHVSPLCLAGASHVQNPTAMAAPVSDAATNPARLFRGARGKTPKRRLGRRGVRLP